MSAPQPKPDTGALQREAAMVNLDRFIAEREIVEEVELGLPPKELLARYERLSTNAISDVLREHCLMEQTLPNALVPLRPGDIVVGDIDGVIVVPRRLAVLERAEEILGNERKIFSWVADGESVQSIAEKGAYF